MAFSMRQTSRLANGLRDFCLHLLHRNCTGTMLEIGVYTGESTCILSEYFDVVWAVDPWRPGYDDQDPASKDNGLDIRLEFVKRTHDKQNIKTLQLSSADAAALFSVGSLDCVYIDGCHTRKAVHDDLRLWADRVKPLGFVGGHDYGRRGPAAGVTQAVDEWRQGAPITTFCDGSWVVQKGNNEIY